MQEKAGGIISDVHSESNLPVEKWTTKTSSNKTDKPIFFAAFLKKKKQSPREVVYLTKNAFSGRRCLQLSPMLWHTPLLHYPYYFYRIIAAVIIITQHALGNQRGSCLAKTNKQTSSTA